MKKTKKKGLQKKSSEKKRAPQKGKKGWLILVAFAILAIVVYMQWGPEETSTTQVQERGTDTTALGARPQDPCSNEEAARQQIQAMAEAISTAETEVAEIEIDLEFAQQDGIPVTEIEDAIEKQHNYITEVSETLNKLQESIKDC